MQSSSTWSGRLGAYRQPRIQKRPLQLLLSMDGHGLWLELNVVCLCWFDDGVLKHASTGSTGSEPPTFRLPLLSLPQIAVEVQGFNMH
eukprot:365804-Chlamydomonas_euryale.AAC.4